MITDLGLLTHVDATLLSRQGMTSFTINHQTPYRTDQASQQLSVLLNRTGDDLRAVIADQPASWGAGMAFEEIVEKSGLAPVHLSEPLPLGAVHIPKPWGQEIWYTGIESRGVSSAGGVPLPWLTDIFREYLQCPVSPLLLKILDPLPESNLGDLYFEMHEQKVEVYIVTQVDTTAWPNGVGAIRYGFDQEAFARFGSRGEFLDAYLQAVRHYREVRVDIDQGLAELVENQSLERPLAPDTYRELLSRLPAELVAEETRRRESMYSFTAMRDLKVGDVVTVQPYFPHSLQHGVRVIEFQTPHYERFILSFGQEVLTQGHWDTESALDRVITHQAAAETPMEISPGHEVVADFNEFRVHRVAVPAGGSVETIHPGYTVVTGIVGNAALGDVNIKPEQAFLLRPRSVHRFTNDQGTDAVVLVAEETD